MTDGRPTAEGSWEDEGGALSPQPGHVPAPGDRRVTDRHRDAVVQELRRACGDGSLTLDEFSDRVGAALAAGTRAELDRTVEDLRLVANGSDPSGPGPATGAARRRARTWLVSVMGGNAVKGRWRPGARVRAVAVMGGCQIDLRAAQLDGDEVVITAVAVMGGIDVIVPEGIEVELTGVPLLGAKTLRIADVPPVPGSPLVRVRAVPVMGAVAVKSRRPHRSRSERRALRQRERALDRGDDDT